MSTPQPPAAPPAAGAPAPTPPRRRRRRIVLIVALALVLLLAGAIAWVTYSDWDRLDRPRPAPNADRLPVLPPGSEPDYFDRFMRRDEGRYVAREGGSISFQVEGPQAYAERVHGRSWEPVGDLMCSVPGHVQCVMALADATLVVVADDSLKDHVSDLTQAYLDARAGKEPAHQWGATTPPNVDRLKPVLGMSEEVSAALKDRYGAVGVPVPGSGDAVWSVEYTPTGTKVPGAVVSARPGHGFWRYAAAVPAEARGDALCLTGERVCLIAGSDGVLVLSVLSGPVDPYLDVLNALVA